MTSLTIHRVPGSGAEDVVVAGPGRREGSAYTGTSDGSIFRVAHDGSRIDEVANTGGRPLGLEFHPDGRLLVCDAEKGLLLVDPERGGIEALVSEVDGIPMRFCNNAAIAEDGTIWFSDSSTAYSIDRWKDEFVQKTATGRLLKRTHDGEVSVVLNGLDFANGVALASDGSFVAVAETSGRTVLRHWLSGDRAGTTDLLVGDLPGYPDNIARGSDGLIWVAIASPRDPLVEQLQRGPQILRRAVTRIPEALQPKPKRTARVQAYDDEGRLVHDLDLPATAFHMATGVREYEGRAWLGSLVEPAIAVVDVPAHS